MTNDFCTTYSVLYIFSILKNVFELLCTIIPIIIIILIMIDYFKAVISNEENAIKLVTAKSAKRLIAEIIVFFVPTIVSSFMSIMNFSIAGNFTDCFLNSDNLEYYKMLEEEKAKAKEEQEKAENNESNLEEIKIVISNYNSNTTSEGSKIGKTYNLTENELKFLTSVAICENGLDGMQAQLSLMANLYELNQNLQKQYGSLPNYVLKGPWFACGNDGRNTFTKYSNYKEEGLAITKEVLVLGNRPYPYYINEHDCWDCNDDKICHNTFYGDVCTVEVNGKKYTSLSDIKNKNNYIKNVTKVFNTYDSIYTFYEFPCKSCDPFGYTKDAKDKYDRLNNS